MTAKPKALSDVIWENHVVARSPERGAPDTVFIDLHLVHEVTSPQAFSTLRERGLALRRPGQTIATMDHSTPTTPPGPDGRYQFVSNETRAQVDQLILNCQDFGVPLHALGTQNQGIVHVIAPELGLIHPGMTVVCGDSHTSTHGAFGALAFGIGTNQVGHVFATQCLLAHPSPSFEIRIEGQMQPGVSAKDVILAVIAEIGSEGGAGHVFEFTGRTVTAMSMEERLTVCNMAIEGGARAGLVAPDDTTFNYLEGRPFAPKGRAWERSLTQWRELDTDREEKNRRSVTIDATRLEPMVTFGTSPGMGIPIDAAVPDPAALKDAESRASMSKALRYMEIEPGKPMRAQPVDVVFLGSCTNSRLSDLKAAATILKGRKVHPRVRMLVVPGSQSVKSAAESEGLHDVFRDAGAEWREPGCSLCLAMNGDQLEPGQLAVSTSNRNFEGRQGPASRTVLASPLTAAACAVAGEITDVREMI